MNFSVRSVPTFEIKTLNLPTEHLSQITISSGGWEEPLSQTVHAISPSGKGPISKVHWIRNNPKNKQITIFDATG